MRKISSLVMVLVVFLTFSSIFAGEKEVRDAVNKYVTSINSKDDGGLNDVLYKSVMIVGVNKIINKSDDYNKDSFVAAVKSGRIGGWGKDINIKMVNDNDRVATAYVEISNAKLVQREYVTLVLDGGKWKITGSVYSIEKL